MSKTFWSVDYDAGDIFHETKWFDSEDAAELFSSQKGHERPVMHTYDDEDSIKRAEKLVEESRDIQDMTDEQLAEAIRKNDQWDLEMVRELCDRANLLDELDETDVVEGFEQAVEHAAEVLGVEIYDQEEIG